MDRDGLTLEDWMSVLNWPTEPIELIRAFEIRHNNPASGALFSWAVWEVESLQYLDDIDRAYDASRTVVGAHRPDVVDVAHARWATGTSISALDLCAAGLGRTFCSHREVREFALAYFDPQPHGRREHKENIHRRRAQLPLQAKQWVDDVFKDSQYTVVKGARDWLTHSRVTRHFTLATREPDPRLELELDETRLPVRKLIEHARDLATRHVIHFMQILPQI